MKKKIIAIAVCTILLMYFIGGILYSFIKKEEPQSNLQKIGETIKGYDYVLYEKELKNYEKEFKVLKNILEKDEIDYKDYATSISKLFIIDLYTLNNKKNKYDVGGTEFVYPNILDNYKLNVEETLYKYIIDSTDNDRKQKLPIVKEVLLESIEEIEYKIDKTKYNAYKVILNIEYEEDLGYDKKAEIISIKENNYLYIVEKK